MLAHQATWQTPEDRIVSKAAEKAPKNAATSAILGGDRAAAAVGASKGIDMATCVKCGSVGYYEERSVRT